MPNRDCQISQTTGSRASARRLYHPRRDRWYEHFAWHEDCSLMMGLTAVGRTTIAALRLNRPNLVNLRKVLYQAQIHPPLDEPG
ncbi:hypothetical protein HC928_03155 [bacterium]|nr:hypothetical protein [bacterium]